MKENKLTIKKAALAMSTGIYDTSYKRDGEQVYSTNIVEFKVLKVIDCIVDENNKGVVDIDTFEFFPIVQRNCSRLIYLPEIDDGQVYALNLYDIKFKEMKLSEQFELKKKAKRAQEAYMEKSFQKKQSYTLKK